MSAILDALDQDETWTEQSGRTWRLEDMTPSHRRNLLRWLRQRATGIKWHYDLAMAAYPMPSIDTVAYDMVMSDLDAELRMSPQRWLAEQPLVVRLVELVDADNAAEAAS